MTDEKYQEEIQYMLNADETFRYRMLSRLQMDCNYFLGNARHSERVLWATDDAEHHLMLMEEIYNSFAEDRKPEWLTMEQISSYKERMLNSSVNYAPCHIHSRVYMNPTDENGFIGTTEMLCVSICLTDSDETSFAKLIPLGIIRDGVRPEFDVKFTDFGITVFNRAPDAWKAAKRKTPLVNVN